MNRIYYFTAPWCPPCKQTKPIVEEMNNGEYKSLFEMIDVDLPNDLTKEYGITSIPTFVMVDEIGQEIRRTMGGKNRSQLEEFING